MGVQQNELLILVIDFLEQHYHLSQIDATLANDFSTLGSMVGAPFFGVLSHKVKNVIPIMFYAIVGFLQGQWQLVFFG
ncbi:TPA: hypothetical protein JBE16_14945 [Legionella pneumophila subsp. pneumophila]|uniref:hypothetical protein n=1 Tax=Legionella sp. PATHC039 TaxID=2992042 RepID=UPI001A292FA8|nr:hypothetical protein [Legionella sp. PATHC039]MCW8394408.1 hypothetical protein [Legionella sp. PATHC039]HAT8860294.1 hypothetical protein [Legionella pneumophila subsp. pneumophila]HAT9652102.1 hypothetical protein [Legionella pneumophila subsp. pneumophila]HAT9921465.1 hypothetical protein [Legionella pneumophila subsp. pneumophila]